MTQIIELLDGRRACLQVVGRGIPALMIPDGPGISASCLSADAGLFPYVLRSYLVDPPGPGSPTRPGDPGEYSPCDLARFYEEVRKTLGLSRVVVLGHASGPSAALAYAAMFPRSTAACIAIARLGVGCGAGTDLRPLLSRMPRPALVLAGGLDPVSAPAQARLAARAALGAQLVVLPDCGRLPALDAPDSYREVVLDFLRSSY
jgi:pimeloyl-ACP methyl ester carboxylesterase